MLGGQLTLSELEDFLALCEYRISQLAKAYAKIVPSWAAKDPNAFLDWSKDWNALQHRYAEVASRARSAITMEAAPFLVPATELYEAVARTMRQAYPEGASRKGDWSELRVRLSQVTSIPDGEPPTPKAIDADTVDSAVLAEMIRTARKQP